MNVVCYKYYDCPKCSGSVVIKLVDSVHGALAVTATQCPHCKSAVALPVARVGRPQARTGEALVALGYVFALVSLLLFPPAFGIAGFVCGVTNVNRGREGHGIAQVVLSVICGGIGMLLGYNQVRF